MIIRRKCPLRQTRQYLKLEGKFAVYVVAVMNNDGYLAPCKVGHSATPARRLATMQGGSPVELGMAAVFHIGRQDAALAIEGAFHEQFAHSRIRGEWFDVLPEEACAAVQKLVDALRGPR